LFIRQQTAVINVIRAHLAEFGIVAPVGRKGVEALLDVVPNPTDKRVPVIARACLAALGAQRATAVVPWAASPRRRIMTNKAKLALIDMNLTCRVVRAQQEFVGKQGHLCAPDKKYQYGGFCQETPRPNS
jgi:hypothetical protein